MPASTPHSPARPGTACRFCGTRLRVTFADLGLAPLCETFIRADQLAGMEPFYPLHACVCERCLLVQLQEFALPQESFDEDASLPSSPDSRTTCAGDGMDMLVERFAIDDRSLVMQVSSGDGSLLEQFVARGVPVLGIERSAPEARAAGEKGVPTVAVTFGRRTAAAIAARHGRPNLLVCNDALTRVHDINDFVGGLKILLASRGVIVMELPHLARLIEGSRFDAIRHRRFSYPSFLTAERILAHHGLTLFDVEEIPADGGRLRIFARHCSHDVPAVTERVAELKAREQGDGYRTLERYRDFGEQAKAAKRRLLSFLIEAKDCGRTVAGYGATGGSNTLLNYCGIRTDLLDFTVDPDPGRQGCYTPGTRIPIHPPQRLREARPDYVLVLPGNLDDEIAARKAIREWGGRFVVPLPEVTAF